ncbi:hypothetical protein BD626DRAFT_513541 [Schizophyllum amplum]|uniref:Mug135-like C-terminal domain-containing protein n=1 Tax=Schizophyllum amplum TaxID=97359 RepID=A0A550BZ55_9AGAR|nr:hypothetical protein BD626DRAFT_513541 [Auriculariopsis ampla]
MPPVLRSHTKRFSSSVQVASSSTTTVANKNESGLVASSSSRRTQARKKPPTTAVKNDDAKDTEEAPFPLIRPPAVKPCLEQIKREAVAKGIPEYEIDAYASWTLRFQTALYNLRVAADECCSDLDDPSICRVWNLTRGDGSAFQYEIMPFSDSARYPWEAPYNLPKISHLRVLNSLSMRELSWYLQGYHMPVPPTRTERIALMKEYMGITV